MSGTEQVFPLAPGAIVTVTCDTLDPGRVGLISGDTVVTCKTEEEFKYNEEPKCRTEGRRLGDL